MRSSLVVSLIGMTSLALALLVGCGDDDNKPVTSKVGQSCTRTADCDPGLSCIGNVCYKVPPASGGAGGGANLVPPPLGSEGQSCTSRLDCRAGLDCFNNRCTAPASGDAGASSGVGPQLSARGESCRVNSDCDKDLVCVATAVVGTGICDLAHFGVEATGLTCSGECLEAEDCCQLPLALHTTNIRSCQDIADSLDGVDCDAPPDAAKGKLCFEQWAYCDCHGKKTWSCDEDTHACVYQGECDPAAGLDAPNGCPSHSRLHDISARSCNTDTNTCVGAAASTACTNDKSCEGKPVVDSTADDLCTVGECTCYSGNKQCYRKCARDIDCGAGQICDGKTKVCKPDAACVTDSQCAIANRNVAFKCNDGTCAQACVTDRDCSPSGVSGAFAGKVCGADGFCASVAQDCNEDSQCAPLTVGGLKPFCVTPPPAAGDGVASAVTN